MHVLALAIEVHLPASRSLKHKRAVLRPLLDGIRSRYPGVAVAETNHQDRWQRAEIGVAAVSGSARTVRELLDEVERFVWSFPDLEVLTMRRYWAEETDDEVFDEDASD
ncbi:MAG TPA: DUF503 domain-containing protein [Acidimicrobiales bacterium]